MATAPACSPETDSHRTIEAVDIAATVVSTPMADDAIGTGAAGAARPSTPPTFEISNEELDAEKEHPRDPSHQRCESPNVTFAGCVRARLSRLTCSEYELDMYLLLEDDGLAGRPARREAFLRARHGKGYIMLIRNKRCVRSLCWRRGSLWGHEGVWSMECPRDMKRHLLGARRKHGRIAEVRHMLNCKRSGRRCKRKAKSLVRRRRRRHQGHQNQ